jgi:hypothetical protein
VGAADVGAADVALSAAVGAADVGAADVALGTALAVDADAVVGRGFHSSPFPFNMS